MTDDALTIARWLYPTRGWILSKEDGDVIPWCAKGSPRSWNHLDIDTVHAAERVLIERGHAEAYGKALAHAMLVDGPFVERSPCGARDVWWRLSGEEASKLATTPLAARVRAMAAVIQRLT